MLFFYIIVVDRGNELSELDSNVIDGFKKPNLDNMSLFLKLHLFQPTNDTDLPFVSKKAFF